MKSFPDLQFSGFTTRATSDSFSFIDVVVSGTHTGKPFGLADDPGCPVLKAKGQRAVNDPETLELTIEDEKIAGMKVIASSEKTGPPGLYMQIAGMVECGEEPDQEHKLSSFKKASSDPAQAISDPVDQLVLAIAKCDLKQQLGVATDDCVVKFEDMPPMPWKKYVEMNGTVSKSFPDFNLSGFKKSLKGDRVTLVDSVASGTFTGEPYGLFGAPNMPLIKATGMKVANSPETLEFLLEGDKIKQMRILAAGEYTGPQGLCSQVSGF